MAKADAPNANARQQRILSHVNNDHKEALSHYLQHFAKVASATASTPQTPPVLVDVDLNKMVIRAGGDGKEHTVNFTPPLSSWEEMRGRFVEMDTTARDALSDVVVTEYAPPEGTAAAVFCLIVFYFTCYASLGLVVPGSPLWNLNEAIFPGGAVTYKWVVSIIFWPVVAIHTAEAIAFDQTRMKRHGVPRFGVLWWLWEVNCWVEGYTCWKRIDEIIEEKREIKAKRAQKTE